MFVDSSSADNKDRRQNPIGLFDSGVGGLSVYQHLLELLPNENYVYYADTLNVPYGGRDRDDIIELTLKAIDKLYRLNCKLIVIACNSASAHALQIVRKQYTDIPIVGLVPALKPAVLASKTKRVAVLATQATLDGRLLSDVINDIALPRQVSVEKYYKSSLVPWVESGMAENAPEVTALKELLNELASKQVDQLVLGCTHYPFFRAFLEQQIIKRQLNIAVVDSGKAIALRVQNLLEKDSLQIDSSKGSKFDFYTSRDTDALRWSLDFLLKQ